MLIKYLGTSAAEGTPAPFCSCEVCSYSRRVGGRNIRTRSQALIDGRLLIDYPGDTYMHVLNNGLCLEDIDACILTHTHHDHFFPEDLFFRTNVAAHTRENKPLSFYAPHDGVEILNEKSSAKRCVEQGVLTVHEAVPFLPFEISGYRITPLAANHCPYALIYIIEKDGTAILYANDTGLLPEETLDYIKGSGVGLDLVSYDCTYGTWHRGNLGHLDYEEDKLLREQLRDMGVLKEGCRHVLTHFSHNNGGYTYDTFAPLAESDGFTVAYDGMELEI